MLKKFNSVLNISILLTAVYALTGIVLVVFPSTSISVISYIVSISLIVVGIMFIVKNHNYDFLVDFLSIGIVLTILGIILLVYPKTLETFIPIVVGIEIIVNSIFKIRLSMLLKEFTNDWLISFLLNILMIFCGVALIINPEVGALTITTFVGILLIVYSVSDLIEFIIFKRNVNDLVKYFK